MHCRPSVAYAANNVEQMRPIEEVLARVNRLSDVMSELVIL